MAMKILKEYKTDKDIINMVVTHGGVDLLQGNKVIFAKFCGVKKHG